MPRSDNDTWDLATSVGATATMVAADRARAARAQLIEDRFAEPLVAAVGIGHTVPALIAAGHGVTAMARSDMKAEVLRGQGAAAVQVSLFDQQARPTTSRSRPWHVATWRRDASTDDPDTAFVDEAAKHPVFRLTGTAGAT